MADRPLDGLELLGESRGAEQRRGRRRVSSNSRNPGRLRRGHRAGAAKPSRSTASWLGRDGAGWFAPPMPGRIVWVEWPAGSAGHPVITSAAPRPIRRCRTAGCRRARRRWKMAKGPRSGSTPTGGSLIGHRSGAEVSTDLAGLWRIASATETLHAVLAAMIEAWQGSAHRERHRHQQRQRRAGAVR